MTPHQKLILAILTCTLASAILIVQTYFIISFDKRIRELEESTLIVRRTVSALSEMIGDSIIERIEE